MSDRPTPETDALYAQMLAENPGNFIHLEEFLELACRLERERDEARGQAQRLRVQLNHYTQANEMAEQAFRERDEAHKIAKRAIDDLAWFNETNAQRLRNELEQIKEETK